MQEGGQPQTLVVSSGHGVTPSGELVLLPRNIDVQLANLPVAELPPGEPVFAIQVRLRSASVLANGQTRPLQAGMRLEADILQERRKLYEWVLEPLYSVTRRQTTPEATP